MKIVNEAVVMEEVAGEDSWNHLWKYRQTELFLFSVDKYCLSSEIS